MKKKALSLLLALAFCLALPIPASANSAEPPGLTVLVLDPPEELRLTLTLTEEGADPMTWSLRESSVLWEKYYRFFGSYQAAWGTENALPATLLVEMGEESFSLPIDPEGFSRYNNLVTLDVAGKRLLYGQPWWRQPLLIFLRVSLTLVLEGLVFLLFGYRQKRSWLVFLLVNLVTQLGVNLCIYCVASPTALEPYAALIYLGLLLYTPMEILVLVAEAIAFSRLLKEHRKRRAVGYAFVANLFSWALGGALLAYLPL